MHPDLDDPLLDPVRSWFATVADDALARSLPWATVITCLVDDGPLELRPDAPHRLGGPDGALLVVDVDVLDPCTTSGMTGALSLFVGGWDDRAPVTGQSFPHTFGPSVTTRADAGWTGSLARGVLPRALRAVTTVTWTSYVAADFEAFAEAVFGDDPDDDPDVDSAGDAAELLIPAGTVARIGPAVTGIGYDSRWSAPGGETAWLPLLTVESHDAADLMIGDAGWLCLHGQVGRPEVTWASIASS